MTEYPGHCQSCRQIFYGYKGKKYCSLSCYHEAKSSTPMAVRFWRCVERRGPDECWPAHGSRLSSRYGYIRIKFQRNGVIRNILAHRLSWMLRHGREIPDGMLIMHTCDNPPCVNPSHLVLGTKKTNAEDASIKGRYPQQCRTHCKHGHEFTVDNTIRTGERVRRCKTCMRTRTRLWLQARRRTQREARVQA